MNYKKPVTLIMLLYACFVIANLCVPERAFSSREFRYLEPFPKLTKASLVSGAFTKSFENYASDQVIFRDEWVRLSALIDRGLGRKDNNRVYFGSNQILFSMPRQWDETQSSKNIEHLNTFISRIESDASLYLALIPSKETIMREALPQFAPTINEMKLWDDVRAFISKKIQPIWLYPETMAKHKNPYYRTDHHWTYYGIQSAITMLKHAMNFDRPVSVCQPREVTNLFYGSQFRQVSDQSIPSDTIDACLHHEDFVVSITSDEREGKLFDFKYLNEMDSYRFFLGGDSAKTTIRTSSTTGKTLVMIKDSFANSMVGELLSEYETIIMIDPRYYKESVLDIVNDPSVDDILIMFNIQTLFQDTSILQIK